jgi:hypothetical protein
MASATLTDLSARLLSRISGSANDQGLSATQLTIWINAALKHVQMVDDWPWLVGLQTFNTAAGTSTYPTPDDWLRTHVISATDEGESMKLRSIGEMDEIIYQGRPVLYSIDQEQIVLKPIPDGVYPMLHRYYSTEALLASGSDTPKIPVQFDEGVIEYASVLGLRFLRQEDRAKMAEAGFDNWLKVTQSHKQRTRESLRVRVRAGAMI